jgi:putative ABC transport system permease protein
MKLRRAARLSVRALLGHKLRTALALASVGVGTAGVLLTSAVGAGAGQEASRSIEAAGSNLLVVRPAPVKRSPARPAVRGLVTTLRLEDHRAIAGLPPDLVREAAPGLDAGMRVKAGAGSATATVIGTGPALVRLRRLRLQAGRFFDEDDDAGSRRVAVLGARLAGTLFPGEDAVGREVRLRGQAFEVVGVLAPKGIEPDGSDQDGNVFIPIRTALRRVFNTTWLTSVSVSVPDRSRMRAAESALRVLLRERHGLPPGAPDDFAVQDQVRVLAMQQSAVEGLRRLGAGLSGVAMLVGGTGILALMLLSVKERTAEIGLRMAVGARSRDVLLQFLGEAALLAVGGWVVGTFVAATAVTLLAWGTRWAVAFPAEGALASFLIAVATGVGAGVLPARKASRLMPIRALAAAL